MANYSTLKADVARVIKTNGNNEITGQLMQDKLLSMIDSLGSGYQYAGLALPTTKPGSPDERVFYLATQTGTYTYFGGTVIGEEGFYIFINPAGSWQLVEVVRGLVDNDTLSAALSRKQNVLVSGTNIKTVNGNSLLGSGNIEISGGGSSVTVDDALSSTSTNPVQNKAITKELNSMDTALANKQAKLVSGTNIKTVNGNSLLGSGDIEISGGTSVTVDDKLDTTSTNPVQNKVVTNRILGLATQVSGKQETLVSGTNIKTVNGNSLLGAGNIDISGGSVKNDTFEDGHEATVTCSVNTIHSGTGIETLKISTNYDSSVSSDGSEETFVFTTGSGSLDIQINGVLWNNTGAGAIAFANSSTYVIRIKLNKTLGVFLCDASEYLPS